MKQKRLGNICKEILGFLEQKRELDEEQAYILFEGILDRMMSEEEENVPNYSHLSDLLEDKWHYKDLDDTSSEELFLMGGLWGSIQVAESYFKRLKKQEMIKNLVSVHRKNTSFFRIIYQNPGIRHKDLAIKLKQSPSQLSQFVFGMEKEGLISCNRVGREKYYYLQKYGELVYKALEKEKKKYGAKEALVNQNTLKMEKTASFKVSFDPSIARNEEGIVYPFRRVSAERERILCQKTEQRTEFFMNQF